MTTLDLFLQKVFERDAPNASKYADILIHQYNSKQIQLIIESEYPREFDENSNVVDYIFIDSIQSGYYNLVFLLSDYCNPTQLFRHDKYNHYPYYIQTATQLKHHHIATLLQSTLSRYTLPLLLLKLTLLFSF